MAPRPGNRRLAPYDVRMLAMADRLFAEFDQLPVRTVLTAIARARSLLRDQQLLAPDPDEVERLARDDLRRRAGEVDLCP